MENENQNNTYTQTHKEIVKSSMFLLCFYIFSSTVLIVIYGITDFSLGVAQDIYPHISTIVSNVVTAFLCCILLLALIRQNSSERSEIKEILIFFFTFSAMPAFIVGFHYVTPANDPILVDYNLISPQFLIPGATFFLAFFVIEIFDKGIATSKNKIKLRVILLVCAIACGLNLLNMFYGIGPEKDINIANLINIFYYLIILPLYGFYYILLMKKSYDLMQRIKEEVYRKGVMYLGISGAILGIIYLARIILFFISPAASTSLIAIIAILDYGSLAGYILMYLGITLPSKNKQTASTEKQLSKMMQKIIEMQQKEKIKKQKSNISQDIVQTRLVYEKSGKMMKVAKKVKIENISIDTLEAEMITPKQNQSSKVILYLHGGGYLYCSIQTHRGLASLISECTQIPVLIIDYRKAPENKFPAALDDALKAYDWLVYIKSFQPENIIIGGDSAGGGLAMASLLKLKELKKPLPKAAFLISPWLDLTLSGDSIKTKQDLDVILDLKDLQMWAETYLDKEDAKNPYASPLFGDLSKLPPIFIQVGSSELLCSDSTRLFELLKAENNAGDIIIWKDLIHAFPLFAAIKFIGRFIPESNEALVKIKKFIDNVYH
jgi:epsilon-lactone hydrolase